VKDPTTRFSDRIDNYIRYRPSYPAAAIDLLVSKCSLDTDPVVADVGSGTGILTRQLLDRELTVMAIEPNTAMRNAAVELLSGYSRMTSIAATAEQTSLASDSVDLIVVGQAFHWFDQDACRREFARILRAQGQVALIWNERLVDATLFQREYEACLRKHSRDYGSVDHRNIGAAEISRFFSPDTHEVHRFPNEQRFDLEGLIGRCVSSSYMPNEGSPDYAPLVEELSRLFNAHQAQGTIRIEYTTSVYLGHLSA
jgi:ubiquinone/menaquinone biosynthesis C-methylase UbiE